MTVDQKELIERGARYFHRKLAAVFVGGRPNLIEGRPLSFTQVNERARRLANSLAERGFKPGTRIATLMHNCLEYLEVEFGLMKGAFTQVVLNPMLSGEELLYQVNHSEAEILILQERYQETVQGLRNRFTGLKTLICLDGRAEGMLEYEAMLQRAGTGEPPVALGAEDLGELRYSGGTTGTPKGIMLPYRSAAVVSRDILMEYLGDLTAEDRWLSIQPLFHGAGWFNLPVWVKGMTQYIVNDFHAEPALEVIERERITAIKTIPTVLIRLLDCADIRRRDLTSVKTIIYGGEPMPETRLKEAIGIFGQVFMQLYGQTEMPMTIAVLRKEDHREDRRLRSVGRPCSLVKVKVVDQHGREVKPGEVGEVLVQGEQMMLGYLGNPAVTNDVIRDGWLHTKDLGTVDEDGYVYLSGGRTTDMIISGGENIYPREVEQVLYLHPAVGETCVFGMAEKKWGEAVAAAVVLKPGCMADEKELIEFCKGRLAGYKKPQRIFFVKELPKSGAGKILRKELVATFGRSEEIQ
jgi:acyl-CoA synthetase (AMP-forming)/AMP-acid ligase II